MARQVIEVSRLEDIHNPLPPHGGRTWKWKEPTGYTFYQAWGKLARARLSGVEFRVLCALLGRVQWTNEVRVSVSQLAREADLSRPQASLALKRLEAQELVVTLVDGTGQRWGFRVSPHLTWQGRPWACHIARVQYAAALWLHRHGTDAAAQRAAEGSSPHPDGTHRAGKAPSPDYPPLPITESV